MTHSELKAEIRSHRPEPAATSNQSAPKPAAPSLREEILACLDQAASFLNGKNAAALKALESARNLVVGLNEWRSWHEPIALGLGKPAADHQRHAPSGARRFSASRAKSAESRWLTALGAGPRFRRQVSVNLTWRFSSRLLLRSEGAARPHRDSVPPILDPHGIAACDNGLQLLRGDPLSTASVRPIASSRRRAKGLLVRRRGMGRHQLSEPPLKRISLRSVVLAKAEEPPGVGPDNRQEPLGVYAERLADQQHDLPTIQRFRWRCVQVELAAGRSQPHPRLDHQHHRNGLVPDTNQARRVGQVVLGPFVRQRAWDERQQSRRRRRQERGRHRPDLPHRKRSPFLRLAQEHIEGGAVGLGLLAHRAGVAGHANARKVNRH